VKKRIYLSLGANMGDRLTNLRNAIEGLREVGDLVAQSSMYETEPVDVDRTQSWFFNCAVVLETE
jgi:2-amino-4-hydroxy-6-hydroxymethyldihydropteridine diphosphokinase